MLRTRRVENLRHGALTTTAGTREGSTITATASPHSCACELASTKYSTWYGKARRKVLEGSLVLFPERRNTLQLEMG